MGPFGSGAVNDLCLCVHYGSQNANMNETDSTPEALWLLTSGCKTCASSALLECRSFCKVDSFCVVFDGSQLVSLFFFLFYFLNLRSVLTEYLGSHNHHI